jgi:hypothetical protein
LWIKRRRFVVAKIERGRERSVTEKEERDTSGARRSEREVVGAKR